MPFCAQCGWQFSDQPKFCRQCGLPIRQRAANVWAIDPPSDIVIQQTRWQEWQPYLLVGLLAFLSALAVLVTGAAGNNSVFLGFPLDEAWVRLVYARNLQANLRLEFNPGQPGASFGSLSWVVLLAILIKTLGSIGISVVALAKGVSLLAGTAVAVLAALLARRVSQSKMVGMATGIAVAVEPTLAFSNGAGLEVSLFTALALATCLTFVQRRVALTGILLGLTIFTRLEGLGLLPIVCVGTAYPFVRDLIRDRTIPRLHIQLSSGIAVIWGIVPSLVAIWLWMQVNYTAGSALPSAVRAAWTLRPGPNLPDVFAIWSGYLEPWVGILGGGGWLITAPLILIGCAMMLRRDAGAHLPLIFFPIILLLGISAAFPMPREPWTYDLRRYVDSIIPFCMIAAMFGLQCAWYAIPIYVRRLSIAERFPQIPSAATVLAAIVAGSVTIMGLLANWETLPAEYARSVGRLTETYYDLALLARNPEIVPESALIAAIDPGVVRYVSRRPVADLRGVHTPSLQGKLPIDALVDARPAFAALPHLPQFDSFPGIVGINNFPADMGTARSSIGLFRAVTGWTAAARDTVYAFPGDRMRRLDYLDIGNEPDERAHNYTATESREVIRRTSRISASAAVTDDGRIVSSIETFTLKAEPGRVLILARRYDSTAPGGFRVSVDNQPVGDWWPSGSRFTLTEDTLRIPAGLIRQPTVVVRLELLPGSTRQNASFAFWSFTSS